MNRGILKIALLLAVVMASCVLADEEDKTYNDDTKLQLQPAHALWQHYDPNGARYAFKASGLKEANRWQKKTRAALNTVIGFQDMVKVVQQPRQLEEVDKGDYVREKLLIRTSTHTTMPVYFLVPKEGARPLPVVIACHGHGYGVKSIVGINKDGTERDKPEGYQKDFAVTLCRSGFAVAALEISCFGERQTDFSHLDKGAPGSCKHTAFLASHLGGSVLGLRVMDVRRLIDYIENRQDMDSSRLGMMGISGGGMLTFFSAAVDERISVCVVSGYFCTFKDSILGLSHCPCNYVHGLGQFGEMSDIVGLIAPRPMLIEAGSRDPIFPIKNVKESMLRTKKVYDIFTSKPNLESDYFEGDHQISGEKAYDFLLRNLAK